MISAPQGTTNGGSVDHRYRQQLRKILGRRETEPTQRIQDILQLAADRFGVELGLLVKVDQAGETYTIDEVSAPHSEITRGLTGNLLSTYCRMVVVEKEPLVLENAPEQGWQDDPAYQSSLLATYIGTEVLVDHEVYGTVCFVDLKPRDVAFDEQDRTFLELIANAVGRVLEERSAASIGSSATSKNLSRAERRYRTALKNSPVLFAKIDTDLRYEWIYNPHPDFDPEAVVGKRDDELDSGPGIDRLTDLKRRTLQQEEQIREEITFERSDGLYVYDVTATPLREGPGDEVTGLVTASLDITDQKQTERKYRELQARYRALSKNFPDGAVGVYDPDLRYTLVEGTLVGKALPSREEFMGRRVPDLFPEDTVRDIEPLFRAAVEEGVTENTETQYGGRDWKVWAAPLRDRDGKICGGLSFVQDITDRKALEQHLREERDRFANLFHNLPTPVIHGEPDDQGHIRIQSINAAFQSVFGLTEEEARGENIQSLIVPPDEQSSADSLRRRLLAGEPVDREVRRMTPDGPRDFRVQVALHEGEAGPDEGYGIYTDITERKRREQTLQERQEKVEALYEATDQLVRADDPCEIAVSITELLNEVFGYLVGVWLVEDDALAPVQLSSELSDHLPARPSFDVQGPSVMAEAFRAGETISFDDIRAADDPVDYGDVRATAVIPIGNHGTISVGALETGAIDDFDRRLIEVLATYASTSLDRIDREAALIEAKEDAEAAARLKSSMMANMSHEIRTPLTSIIGFAEILSDRLDGELGTFAQKAHQSSNRLMRTLESVLELSRLEAGTFDLNREQVQVPAIVEETVEHLRPRARRKNLSLTVELPNQSVTGLLNEEALRRILENLLENAIKFTPEGGAVEVHVHTDADAENPIVLAVEDTGIGIDEAVVPEVFEAFKQESEGMDRAYEESGLGLSIVQEVTDALGGTLHVKTEKGVGSRFVVRLPRTEDTDDAAE